MADAALAAGRAGAWVGGEQVVRAAADGCDACFQGTLHNAEELRRMLALAESATRAELVLAGYLRWGAEIVSRLRGAFGLLICDRRRNTALCARDPIGIHPVFYAEAHGQVLVSTSIEDLLAQPGVPSSVNRPALADHLCHRWPDREETFFEAVRRIPPGHAMEISGGARRMYRYWQPVRAGEDVDWIRDDELERFDGLLDRAVDRCIDGPAGIWLSGGFDSITVAAVAADLCRRSGRPDPYALSLIFPHPDANEEPIQRGVANALGLPHVVMKFFDAVGDDGMLAPALDMCSSWPAPLLSFWLPAYRQLGIEGRRRGCTTILTGGGGDEWLTVTPIYAADLLLALDLKGIYRLGQSHTRSFAPSRLRVARNLLWRFGARPVLAAAVGQAAPRAVRARRRRIIARTTPDWVAPDGALRRALDQRAEIAPLRPPRDFYMTELRETLDHALVSMQLEEVFENGRRIGAGVLQPFLDADLVDFLFRVPPGLLNRGGYAKGLVRQTVARRFPELGLARKKKVTASGFARPLLAAEGARIWKSMEGAPALVEAGIVDREGVKRCMQGALAGGAQGRYGYRIWDILSLEAWLQPRL
jgi:asparagine synthase (glutamine-hydrolysing)